MTANGMPFVIPKARLGWPEPNKAFSRLYYKLFVIFGLGLLCLLSLVYLSPKHNNSVSKGKVEIWRVWFCRVEELGQRRASLSWPFGSFILHRLIASIFTSLRCNLLLRPFKWPIWNLSGIKTSWVLYNCRCTSFKLIMKRLQTQYWIDQWYSPKQSASRIILYWLFKLCCISSSVGKASWINNSQRETCKWSDVIFIPKTA